MRLVSTVTGAVLVAFVLFVAAACGGSGSASIGTAVDAGPDGSSPGATSAESGLDAGAPDGAAPTDDASCPRTYGAATGSCSGFATTSPNGSEAVCVYPEGTCRCTAPRCGGVVFPIEDDAATSLLRRVRTRRMHDQASRDATLEERASDPKLTAAESYRLRVLTSMGGGTYWRTITTTYTAEIDTPIASEELAFAPPA